MESFTKSRFFDSSEIGSSRKTPININVQESELLEERDKPTKPIFSNKNYLASDKANIKINKKWTIAAFCKGLSEIYKNPYLKEKLEQLEETNIKLNIQIKSLEKEYKEKCNKLENQIAELKEKYYNIEKRNFYFQTSSEESSFDMEGDSSEADSD
jgi:hypothetical protein